MKNEIELTRREFVGTSVAAGVAVSLSSTASLAVAAEESASLAGVPVTLSVNDKPHTLSLDPRTSLLDALRENLGLTGAKKGCDHGQCGACTVHRNGNAVASCLTLAVQCDGDKIATVEGLADGENLHPLQAAFIKHDAFQCGFCTSGQLMSAAALLKDASVRTEDQVKEKMSGNLCRCGAYPNIAAAVMECMKS